MIVKELRDRLSQFPDHNKVVVYRADNDRQSFFEIGDVALNKGTPRRGENDKLGFRFDVNGSAEWLFVSVIPEDRACLARD
jgi:hypothetical protein